MSANKLKEVQDYASSRGGECLSSNYVNTRTPLSFKCNVESHPVFEQNPYDLLTRNRWCRYCAPNASDETKHQIKLDEGNMEFVEPYKSPSDTIQVLRCKTAFQHIVHISWDNYNIRTYFNKCRTLMNYIPIYQYNKDGTFVKKYNDVEDLRSENPTMNVDMIKNVIKKKKKYNSASGYKWSILAPVDNKLNEKKEFTEIEKEIIKLVGIAF